MKTHQNAAPDAAPAPAAGDEHLGAVEADRPDDPQHANANAAALDESGLPRDRKKICEDVIGANLDRSQG